MTNLNWVQGCASDVHISRARIIVRMIKPYSTMKLFCITHATPHPFRSHWTTNHQASQIWHILYTTPTNLELVLTLRTLKFELGSNLNATIRAQFKLILVCKTKSKPSRTQTQLKVRSLIWFQGSIHWERNNAI